MVTEQRKSKEAKKTITGAVEAQVSGHPHKFSNRWLASVLRTTLVLRDSIFIKISVYWA